jgi:chromosome segregation ATPase
MTREASDALEPEAESFIVSDRITKTELRRRLGQQADALRALRPNLDRAQGAVQSALQDNDRLRAQNRELQRQLSVAQQEAGSARRTLAERDQAIADLIRDHNFQLERANKAERHLRVVLDLADAYMEHNKP